MAQIFLSYAREDREFAGRIARVLEQSGHSVWWDRRLDGGEEFSAEIEAALDRADVVVVAWSRESVKSRWVRDEAAVGGDSGTLVPVGIDGSIPPMGFRQFHTIDLVGWKGAKRDERTAELLHSIERRLNGKAEPASATPSVATKPRRTSLAGMNWIRAGIAAAVLAILVGAGLWLWAYRSSPHGAPAKPTLALLPLTTASSDPRLRELASATLDSLSTKLSQSGFPVKLLASMPQGATPAADYIIAGDISSDGQNVAATLHLNQAAQGVTITTYRIEASGDDVRNLPERIGVQMAGNLSGSVAQLGLADEHPTDPTLLAELMSSSNASNDWLQSYQNMQRIVAKAPDLRIAQTGLAYFTGFSLDEFPGNQRTRAIAEARHAYETAHELDPSNGDIEGAWCFLHSETLFGECEKHLRSGMAKSPDDSWLNDFLAALLTQVGRFDEATQLQQLSYTHDPYAPNKIAHTVRMLAFSGDNEAQELYQDGTRWWPDHKGLFLRSWLMGLIWRGDFQGISRVEKDIASTHYRPSTEIIAALNSKSVSSLRRACADALSDNVDPLFPMRCFEAFNLLGDEDSVYGLAGKMFPRRVGTTSVETEQIWTNDPEGAGPPQLLTSPSAAPMRRDRRFVPLAERIGLLAYWRSGHAPDFCTNRHEPVCAQILKRG